MLNYGSLLLSPRGRVRRRLYWRATMIFLVLSFWPQIIPRIGLYVAGAFGLVAIYGFACLYTKRLHDLGHGGGWQIFVWLPMLGPLILGPLALLFSADHALAERLGLDPATTGGVLVALCAVGGAAAVGLHILLGVLRGQTGLNRFGPDPGRPLDMKVFD
jgi:uncharacterized membrane protein YhaH (DUF805 family)